MDDAERRATDGAGEERNVDDNDGDHRVDEARPERGDNGQRQKEVWKRHQDIDAAHEERVARGRRTREQSDDRSDQVLPQKRRGDANDEAGARAPNHARKDVAPDLVGAKEMAFRETAVAAGYRVDDRRGRQAAGAGLQ